MYYNANIINVISTLIYLIQFSLFYNLIITNSKLVINYYSNFIFNVIFLFIYNINYIYYIHPQNIIPAPLLFQWKKHMYVI